MRISDWSSDVCSSDLEHDVLVRVIAPVQADQPWRTVRGATDGVDRGEVLFQQLVADDALELRAVPVRHFARDVLQLLRAHVLGRRVDQVAHAHAGGEHVGHLEIQVADQLRRLSRSEEQTSELQSLMRTSYAVFCLKKKKK